MHHHLPLPSGTENGRGEQRVGRVEVNLLGQLQLLGFKGGYVDTRGGRKEGGGGEILMDSKVWSRVPEDILIRVLLRLPFGSVLRFRAVSRRWNDLLSGSSFLHNHAQASARKPWFLLCTVGRLVCAYDPALGRWLTLVKPAVPGLSVIAASGGGGLLCLGNQVAECEVLTVCNPVARALRALCPTPRVRLIHKVAVIEEGSGWFQILVIGEAACSPINSFDLLTDIYDSSTNSWTPGPAPPPDAKFGLDPGTWCGPSFYCITEMPYGVIAFDRKQREWYSLNIPMPGSINTPSLLNIHGKLTMIARVMSKDNTDSEKKNKNKNMNKKTEGIWLWELHEEKKEWVALWQMPTHVCTQFLKAIESSSSSSSSSSLPPYAPFIAVGIGSSAFITTHLSPRVLVFDSITKSCSWLPTDPLFPYNRDFHLLGFCFQPRFNVLP